MMSLILFFVVNILLSLILIIRLKNKETIDILFIGCLLFTFLGNLVLGLTINTVISWINFFLGMTILEK